MKNAVIIDTSPAGSGKTASYLAKAHAAVTQGSGGTWVFIQPTKKLLSETHSRLEALHLNRFPLVEEVTSIRITSALGEDFIRFQCPSRTLPSEIVHSTAGGFEQEHRPAAQRLADALNKRGDAIYGNRSGEDSCIILTTFAAFSRIPYNEMPEGLHLIFDDTFDPIRTAAAPSRQVLEPYCSFAHHQEGIERVSVADSKALEKYLKMRHKNEKEKESDLYRCLEVIQLARAAYYTEKTIVTTCLDPRVIEIAQQVYVLSATAEGSFIFEFLDSHGISFKIESRCLEGQPGQVLFSQKGPSCSYEAEVRVHNLTKSRSRLSLRYLRGSDKKEQSPLGELRQKKLGEAITNCFRSDRKLGGRKEDAYLVCNKDLDALIKSARFVNSEDRILFPGSVGVNSLRHCTVIILMAAINASPQSFNAVKRVFGSARSKSAYDKAFTQGHLYQALMRSKLRCLKRDERLKIEIIVYGYKEKELIEEIVLAR